MKKLFSELNDVLNKIPKLIFYNLRPILIFTVFYTVLNITGCLAILFMMLSISLRLLNINYIGPDNLMELAFTPLSYVLLIITGILFTFFAIFEIAAILHAYNMSKQNKKTSFVSMITAGMKACEKSLLPKNWLIIIFLLIITPIAGIISFSSSTFALSVPEFIRDFLVANKLYKYLYFGACGLFIILQISFSFSFNYYTLDKYNFIESCKLSFKLIKKHYILTYTTIILSSLLFYLFSVAISAIFSEIISIISANNNGFFVMTKATANTIVLSKGVIYAVISPLINLACLTILFHKFTNEKTTNKIILKKTIDEPIKFIRATLFVGVLLVILLINGYIQRYSSIFKDKNSNYPYVVAHRGDSVRAPENTMPAIQLAAIENNRYIEFDVHQTKDGKIIVSHDDNLLRVTGKDVYVHELTYDEVMKLDTGSWFNSDYKGTRFSTLDEVLKFLKPYDMTIQIEIKPTGYDKNLEESVINIIKDNDMVNRCMITCLKLEPLLNIEKIDKNIYTVYSMFLAWGDISEIPVDAYTIEAQNANDLMVRKIHDENKKIFIWTVNNETMVQYYVDINVDGILTDDPIMMKSAIDACDTDRDIKKSFRYYIKTLLFGV